VKALCDQTSEGWCVESLNWRLRQGSTQTYSKRLSGCRGFTEASGVDAQARPSMPTLAEAELWPPAGQGVGQAGGNGTDCRPQGFGERCGGLLRHQV
jgi:hypothetical protein